MERKKIKRLGRRLGAFTLIELLVVIAIIAVLMGVMMPALNRVKELARQQTCSTRLRQQMLALSIYGNENDTKLPLPTTSGAWLQDVAINTINFMIRTGMKREMFYCPSNATHQKYNDLFWEYGNNNSQWDGSKFVNVSDNDFVVSGYCFILQLSKGARPQIRKYETDSEQKIWVKSLQEKMPSMREVVIDSIMGNPDNNSRYGRDFAEIGGGIFDQSGVYDRTSHLKDEVDPVGGNIAFLDGHTEWRKFEPEMDGNLAIPRYEPANSPGFFW